jgi:uncharacterized protein (TIGR03382 family)
MDFALRIILGSGLLCAAACATTLDVAQNFNAANNPLASSAFSYGTGTSASFTALPNLTPNCFGTPSDCLDTGLSFPNSSQVTWNGTGSPDSYFTIVQPGNELRLDPQSLQAIVRFTAPNSSTFAVQGLFEGIDSGQHGTNVSVFVNGVSQFGDIITSFGQQKTFNLSGLVLNSGDHVDFIVTSNSDASFLSTGLSATISDASAPEPGAFSLCVTALGLLYLLLRRRSAL